MTFTLTTELRTRRGSLAGGLSGAREFCGVEVSGFGVVYGLCAFEDFKSPH